MLDRFHGYDGYSLRMDLRLDDKQMFVGSQVDLSWPLSLIFTCDAKCLRLRKILRTKALVTVDVCFDELSFRRMKHPNAAYQECIHSRESIYIHVWLLRNIEFVRIRIYFNYTYEVGCRDRRRRNTPMFNKKFITFNNQRVNNSYDSHLRSTIESLWSRISACVCFAMILKLSHFAVWGRMTLCSKPNGFFS